MKKAKATRRSIKLRDFVSTAMSARPSELFNPPGLTNFLGSVQCATDVMGLQHLTFPPFSQGDTQLGILTVNNKCVHTLGIPIEYKWRPDRIDRKISFDGLRISTVTCMGVMSQSSTIAIKFKNRTKKAKPVSVRIQTGGGVIYSKNGWKTPYSPKEGPSISVTPWEGEPPRESLVENEKVQLDDTGGILYRSRTSPAFSLQATVPRPDAIDRSWLDFSFRLKPGKSKTIHFLVAIGESKEQVIRQYGAWKDNPALAFKDATSDWKKELAAVFTPGNDRYSGHLPTLHTSNKDLRRIYLNTIISVIYLKRIHPESAYGRTYATIMPRYWVTTSFINDWSMTAYLLAMLDPDCLKRTIRMWFDHNIYDHFGTEYVSGSSAGNWYSCNDYAMVRLVTAYIRVSGDTSWLSELIGDTSLLDRLYQLATHYQALDKGNGLADYGDRNSLLEAVGSYTHEVASLNAANVWVLREVADLFEYSEKPKEAGDLRMFATALIPEIQKLYVQGSGFWSCRQPDGELVPVRHAWDFVHVLNFLAKDLPAKQIDEMVRFFEDELMTPSWMAALSALDEDIGFSLRLDHEWNGSWPGWVALATSALVRANRTDLLVRWLPGLAKTTNQGPFSQAHFVEDYASPIDGGARKGPTEWPYINDWAAMCVGGFFETILYDIFGLHHPLQGDLVARPRLKYFDIDAELENVPHHGELFSINTPVSD